jgi:hypothetical protein
LAEAVADRGYFSSPEILVCHEAGITVTLSKPQTSGAKSEGRCTTGPERRITRWEHEHLLEAVQP